MKLKSMLKEESALFREVGVATDAKTGSNSPNVKRSETNETITKPRDDQK